MWRFCCILGRKESKIIEIQRHSKSSVDILPAVTTEPASSLASLCCDDCRRPSWNKSNGHATDNPSRRHSTPYFEVDFETGRRPTLVVEATARLAVAESVDLEHSRRSSSVSTQAVYKPLGGMVNRRKVMPGRKSDPVEVRPRSLVVDLPVEGESSSRCAPTDRKKTGFIKSRSSGSSFRKRMLTRKSNRSGLSRLNFMSRSRPKGCGDTTASQMQTIPLKSARMTPSSRRDSLYIFSHTDEPIVTPFAQILASLRKVRANFICLTNVHSSKDSRFGTSHAEEPRRIPCPDDPPNSMAVETLEELEWCLERLESIQTHRSVSDMASSKFKKMLNKELSQVYDGDKLSSQITEYICSTFLDQDEQTADNQLPGSSGNGGGANGEDDNEPVAASSALVAAVAAAASAAAAAAASKAADTVTNSGVGVVDVGVGITEQKTITAGSSADFRKMQQEGQEGPLLPSSVIVRLDRTAAQKLAAVAAASEKDSSLLQVHQSLFGNQVSRIETKR